MTRALLALLLLSQAVLAEGEWKQTGSAVVGVQIPIGYIKIYNLTHEMRKIPSAKWQKAIQTADADKRLTWTLLLESPRFRIADGFKLRLKENGFQNDPRIDQLISAFPDPTPEGAHAVFTYLAKDKATTVQVDGGKTVTIPGVDFMKAFWGMYFGQGEWAEHCGEKLLKDLW